MWGGETPSQKTERMIETGELTEGHGFIVQIITAADGHDYVVMYGSYSGGICHAVGCRRCNDSNN